MLVKSAWTYSKLRGSGEKLRGSGKNVGKCGENVKHCFEEGGGAYFENLLAAKIQGYTFFMGTNGY
jgi:hypothetical protein